MSYRDYLLVSSGFGALPALIFTILFALVDRPKYRDRYAGLLFGLGIIAFLGFAIPFVLTLFNPNPIPPPSSAWRWGISIIVRGLAGGFMWWLLWIYLTPKRAKHRLGRFGLPRMGGDIGP